MKVSLALAGALLGLAASSVHAHSHRRHHNLHKRADQADSRTVVKLVYVLGGNVIDQDEAQRELEAGTLTVDDKGALMIANAAAAAPPPPPSSSSTQSLPQQQKQAGSSTVPPSSTPPAAASPSPSPSPPPPPPPAAPSSSPASSSSSDSASSSYSNAAPAGSGGDFPDGQLACSHFPSDYGAVAQPYLGLDGYTGIQIPGSTAGGLNNIVTVVGGSTAAGQACSEGAYCSYACPPTQQKSQWPVSQGATGQSVGGLLCQNGKLHLTNPGLSKSLCIPGTDKLKVYIKNTLSQPVSFCRTDYPGTESETIPILVGPGQKVQIACPDGNDYYHWGGKPTSAQIYVNPAGVPVEKACQWGKAGDNSGNWAPLNFGVGFSNGMGWLSVVPNTPTHPGATLDYSITLTESCGYKAGGQIGSGCTASFRPGEEAVYVLS